MGQPQQLVIARAQLAQRKGSIALFNILGHATKTCH